MMSGRRVFGLQAISLRRPATVEAAGRARRLGPNSKEDTVKRCNESGCGREGFDVYDFYGIYAGRWCEEHESNAPGQWDYRANPGEVEDAVFADEEW